ncbi:hypothetical protein M0R45_015520 [Rubus argutus]|uniref:Reverse transcriptase n=1 Tax=Rubus argutus TaxID=59490 RepID=A0AAW1XRW7_RUBAR
MRVTEETCSMVIEQAWSQHGGGQILDKMNLVAGKLKAWEREKFGYVWRSIVELGKELDAIQRQDVFDQVMQRRSVVEEKLDAILQREIMWSQCSRVNWLQYSDRNTTFFHQFAKHRGKVNKIEGILGEDNRWRTRQEEIGCVFLNYFRQLFTTGGGGFNQDIFDVVFCRFSADQALFLTRDYTRGEIESALKDIGSMKALGPDGMPPLFYQKYWTVVGIEVVEACLSVLKGQSRV